MHATLSLSRSYAPVTPPPLAPQRALLSHSRATHSYRAATHCSLYRLTRDAFAALRDDFPEFEALLRAAAAKRHAFDENKIRAAIAAREAERLERERAEREAQARAAKEKAAKSSKRSKQRSAKKKKSSDGSVDGGDDDNDASSSTLHRVVRFVAPKRESGAPKMWAKFKSQRMTLRRRPATPPFGNSWAEV